MQKPDQKRNAESLWSHQAQGYRCTLAFPWMRIELQECNLARNISSSATVSISNRLFVLHVQTEHMNYFVKGTSKVFTSEASSEGKKFAHLCLQIQPWHSHAITHQCRIQKNKIDFLTPSSIQHQASSIKHQAPSNKHQASSNN